MRTAVAALAAFGVLTATPFLLPTESAASGAAPRVARNDGLSACPLDRNFDQTVHLLLTGNGLLNIQAFSIDPNGEVVDVFGGTLEGPSTGYFSGAPGIDGQALVFYDRLDAHVYYNSYGDGTPDSPFAAGPCDVINDIGRQANYPFQDDRVYLSFNNVDSGLLRYDTCVKGTDGGLACEGPSELGGFAQEQTSPRDIGARGLERPLTVHIFANGALSSQLGYEGLNNQEPMDYLPGTDAMELQNTSTLPLDVSGAVTGTSTITYTFDITNVGTSTQMVEVVSRDDVGTIFNAQAVMLPAETTRTMSITNTVATGGWTQVSGSGDLDLTVLNNSAAASPRGRAKGGTGAWRGSAPDKLIAKRGYAAGAPSTKQSKVSVVLSNPNGSATKVKLRIYDGGTGKKVQSGKANIPARGMAVVPFKKKARGLALYVEIRVKGKGSVYGWLKRDYKGDVDYYPAVPRG